PRYRRPPQFPRALHACPIELVCLTLIISGCHLALWPWNDDPISDRFSHVEVKEYREWATQIDYPDLNCEPLPPVPVEEPRRLRNFTKDDLWDMTLQEAVHRALSHCDIIRSSGVFLSPGNPILANPDFAPSAYDIAIQETGVLFGQRGIEAALSEFDAQFTTVMTWGRDERIQNNLFSVGLRPGATLTQDTARFNATVQKRLATGGVFGVTHEWNYDANNVTGQLFPSVYTGRVRTEFRQPLWAGAGTEYTRIAGPITQNIEGVTGVQQGVVIARINGDITIAEFELRVLTLVRDVEELYWRLYLAYQQFDGATALAQAAHRTWQDVEARVRAQATGGGSLQATEARDQLLQIENRLNMARNQLYDIEAQLRRMLALSPNDGRILRPVDQPMVAEFCPDWQVMLADALARRPDLRKQKWNIKRLELELIAAENLTKPRLDFVSGYHVNAFGDNLLGSKNDGVTDEGLGNAYETLTAGKQTGWDIGFEFSVPLGLRFAHAQVRNAEMKLAKARAGLLEQEAEVSHEMAAAFRQLDLAYASMQNGLNRKITSEQRLRAIEVQREVTPDRITRDAVLRAHDQYIQADAAFAQAIVEYNVALMELFFRSGTLLGLYNVHLEEGPWTPEARVDAVEKAASRAHTIPTATMLHSEPPPFAHPVESISPLLPDEAGPAFEGWPQTDGKSTGLGSEPPRLMPLEPVPQTDQRQSPLIAPPRMPPPAGQPPAPYL
ncbi:MAG: TolC family protein, partial [Planctomycetaceae bacterium]|nr:TolC family protein [Planctomycetaceae bacterium]